MGVRYTKAIQRNDVSPNETGSATFNLSEPVQAGMAEMVGFNMKFTAAGASHAANEWGLVKTLTIVYNGNQVFNYTDLAAVNTLATLPRLVALCEDMGGFITSSGSSTAVDSWMWLPLGINLGANARVEVRVTFVAAAAAISAPEFCVWHKYGASKAASIVGNATTVSLTGGSQTQAVIRVPSYPNAVVSGLQIQSTTATDDLVSAIIKPLGDFELNNDALRAIGGRNFGAGELYDYLDGATLVQTDGKDSGQTFVPLYGYSSADSTVVVLLTAATSENYAITPILSVPTSRNTGEMMGTQTQSRATSSASSILDRAED